ncbi:divalent-cation tolerance protein CutA [Lysobacteraceae bacterium NML07-0707]|nr:divalent-cation tolerance protein CutA [Xanthomonadaceae bacterium NML07-0707]
MSILICFNTCPSHECAESIAAALLGEQLAACVNIVPGLTSLYRWQGKIERDAECLLIIKTSAEQLDALRKRLVELHPYELPELVAVQAADGLPAYLDWVRAETT